jgi:pimeloyl-ACP methyl ester carboxylesterase
MTLLFSAIAASLIMMVGSAKAEENAEKDPPALIIRGLILDESDNVLPRVQVRVNGTRDITHTDGNGEFTLHVSEKPTAKATLSITKVGYVPATVPLDGNISDVRYKLTTIREAKGLIYHRESISDSHTLSWILGSDEGISTNNLTLETFGKLVQKKGKSSSQEVLFRVYQPTNTKSFKAAFLISEHGMGSKMMEDPIIRKFADRWSIALVGFHGDPMQRGFGPANLMEEVLTRIGSKIEHPELPTLPVFTFGHSNGTGFSASYPAMNPDKVICWISYHSGSGQQLLHPGIEKVPGLVMHGHLDRWFENGQEEAVKHLRSKRKAPVSLTVGAFVEHWPKDYPATYRYMIAFMEACIRIRYPGHEIDPSAKFTNLALEAGWLGGNYDRSKAGFQKLPIGSYKEFTGDRTSANWLPDKIFAETWRRYIHTGK